MGDASVSPYLQDADFTLYNGDALEILRTLPDESVDCVITSPPYWGLRDYGTGTWEGGDAECDHKPSNQKQHRKERQFSDGPGRVGKSCLAWTERDGTTYGDVCGKCGATRIDSQLGLEPTPEEYVTRMVEVFREVRRVLAKHGTCWLNMGDSYATNPGNGRGGGENVEGGIPHYSAMNKLGAGRADRAPGNSSDKARLAPSLKPKDLCGIPWRLAFALQADGWYLRSDIVWSKPNPMPESVTDRPTKAHEYVFLLSKQPRYFFDQEAVREDATWDRWGEQTSPKHGNSDQSGARWLKSKKPDGGHGSFHRDGREKGVPQEVMARGRNIRSVWEIATQPFPEAHFATFPEELVRRCLLAGCPKGGIVLDPFLGSGTTALVARKHGRRCVGIELNEDYCKLIAKRTQQLGLFSEVA